MISQQIPKWQSTSSYSWPIIWLPASYLHVVLWLLGENKEIRNRWVLFLKVGTCDGEVQKEIDKVKEIFQKGIVWINSLLSAHGISYELPYQLYDLSTIQYHVSLCALDLHGKPHIKITTKRVWGFALIIQVFFFSFLFKTYTFIHPSNHSGYMEPCW